MQNASTSKGDSFVRWIIVTDVLLLFFVSVLSFNSNTMLTIVVVVVVVEFPCVVLCYSSAQWGRQEEYYFLSFFWEDQQNRIEPIERKRKGKKISALVYHLSSIPRREIWFEKKFLCVFLIISIATYRTLISGELFKFFPRWHVSIFPS